MSTEAGRARLGPLWLIVILSASPFVLATLIYFFWKPAENRTVGTLLTPIRTLPDTALRDQGGAPRPTASLRGKWLLLTVSKGVCGSPCRDTLYRLRQVRTAQGKEMNRVERVWVSADGPAAGGAPDELTRGVIRLGDGARLAAALPADTDGLEGDVFLVDPQGNLVMRYDAGVDPVKMIREIAKILKLNNGLG